MSKTLTLVELLAAAIKKGKHYHLFFGPVYLESFYYRETAVQAAMIGDCKVVYISCAASLKLPKPAINMEVINHG